MQNAIPPQHLHILVQLAAQITYGIGHRPSFHAPGSARQNFDTTLRNTIKRFAKYVHPYADRIQVLPPLALGALYEYNYAVTTKSDMRVEHVVPVDQVHPPPGHWGDMKLRISGGLGGPVGLTELEHVEDTWWTKPGKSLIQLYCRFTKCIVLDIAGPFSQPLRPPKVAAGTKRSRGHTSMSEKSAEAPPRRSRARSTETRTRSTSRPARSRTSSTSRPAEPPQKQRSVRFPGTPSVCMSSLLPASDVYPTGRNADGGSQTTDVDSDAQRASSEEVVQQTRRVGRPRRAPPHTPQTIAQTVEHESTARGRSREISKGAGASGT